MREFPVTIAGLFFLFGHYSQAQLTLDASPKRPSLFSPVPGHYTYSEAAGRTGAFLLVPEVTSLQLSPFWLWIPGVLSSLLHVTQNLLSADFPQRPQQSPLHSPWWCAVCSLHLVPSVSSSRPCLEYTSHRGGHFCPSPREKHQPLSSAQDLDSSLFLSCSVWTEASNALWANLLCLFLHPSPAQW